MEPLVSAIHTYISEGLSGNPWDHGTLGRLSMTACRYSEVDALPPTSVVRTCRQKWGWGVVGGGWSLQDKINQIYQLDPQGILYLAVL